MKKIICRREGLVGGGAKHTRFFKLWPRLCVAQQKTLAKQSLRNNIYLDCAFTENLRISHDSNVRSLAHAKTSKPLFILLRASCYLDDDRVVRRLDHLLARQQLALERHRAAFRSLQFLLDMPLGGVVALALISRLRPDLGRQAGVGRLQRLQLRSVQVFLVNPRHKRSRQLRTR